MKCEACNKNESIGVCCVPGCPVSCAYCKECLEKDNHPMNILIANTACCSGLDNAAKWWKEMVIHSLEYQGKTLEWFNEQVKVNIKEMDSVCEEHDKLLAEGEIDR